MLVVVGGSRVLSLRAVWAGRAVVHSLVERGCSLAVGCSRGMDELVLSRALAGGWSSRLSVFAVGGPGGAGFWSLSAVSAVRAVGGAGAQVRWWAGGRGRLGVRLAARSRAAVAVAEAGVWVLAGPASPGSLGAARALALLGRPVFLVCCGFSPGELLLGPSFVLSAVRPACALPPGCVVVRLSRRVRPV